MYFNINYEFDSDKVLGRIDEAVREGGSGYVCVADGNVLQKVHRDEEYRKVVGGAMFSVCDSSWVPLFLKRIHGMKVSRYCGSDLFDDVLKMKKYRMMFLGASREVLEALRKNLSEKYDENIAGMTFRELPFCGVGDFDYASIAAFVNEDRPDIIWVSLGAPKQEIFMNRLCPYLDKGVMIAVGAVFKFYGGVSERRAPQWMIRLRMEFLYRLLSDPGKQFGRCCRIISALPGIIRQERMKQ